MNFLPVSCYRVSWRGRAISDSRTAESETGFRLHGFAVYLQQRIRKKVNRTTGWGRIDNQIASFVQLEAIRRIVTEIIVGQLWMLPCFADIDRNPAPIGEEFRPTMVAFDCAFAFVRGDCCADCETGRNPDRARQGNKVSMEVGAITGPRVAGKHRVAASPAGAGFVVAHPSEHVIEQRFGALDLIGFSGDSLFRIRFDSLVE